MIDDKTKSVICRVGSQLGLSLPGFYGKIVLNYADGKFVVANVEQSVKDNIKRPEPPENKNW